MSARSLLGYRPELDGLRGVAVLGVMVFHSGLIVGGWLGVDLFFALSGFLISTLLLEEHAETGRIHFGRFYLRRALRLLPALVTLVAVLTLVLLATTSREHRIYLALSVVAVLFYFANWVEPFGIPLAWGFAHTWSLAIEEQFYLVWPITMAGLLHFVRRRVAISVIVVCSAILAFIYRMVLARAGASHIRLFEGSDTHADSLLIGCSLAFLMSWNLLPSDRRSRLVIKGLAPLSLLTLLVLFVRARYPIDYVEHGASTFTALCAVMIIADVLSPRSLLAPVLRNWLLVRTGRVSYGLYLWHQPIFFALGIYAYRPIASPWIIAVGWIATAGISLISFAVIEQPALRLKARLRATDGAKDEQVSGKVEIRSNP